MIDSTPMELRMGQGEFSGALARWHRGMRRKFGVVAAALAIPCSLPAQQYGLDTLEPIGPYLGGTLPATTPGQNGVGQPPALLSQTGVFTNLAALTPRSGLIPFGVNSPLWTDGAAKKRWLAVPNDGTADTAAEKITFSATGSWVFPRGTVLVKQFDLPVDARNPGTVRRMETRFLVRGSDGVYYGVTYKWRADGTEADLLPGGEDLAVSIINADGSSRSQTWTFPSRTDCRSCHNDTAGIVLGPRTHQLNGLFSYPATGRSDNQLRTLNHLGLLSPALNEGAISGYLKSVPLTDAGASLEAKVRSYIDANCSHCHQPGNNAAYFDARFTTPLQDQEIVNGPVLYDLGRINAHVVTPQSTADSMMHARLSVVGLHQMPPIGRNTVDAAAVTTLAAWINSLPPDNNGGVNRAPVAANDEVSTAKDTAIEISVAANDTDADNDPLTVDPPSAPAYGTAVLLAANRIRYTPPAGFTGTDTFGYTVQDGRGGSAAATVTVRVLAPAAANSVSFTNASSLLSNPAWSSGVAMGVADMNQDGRDDIVHLNLAMDLRIDYQQPNGAPFTSLDLGTVSAQRQWAVALGDADNNGFPDILTGGFYDGLSYFRANGSGTNYSKTVLNPPSIFCQALSFADISRDGWLDIFACHDDAESAKLRNNGAGGFTVDQWLIDTRTSPASDNSGNYGAVWTDYDNDGDNDLYISKCRATVTNPADPRRINQLFRNNGNGSFTNVAASAGLAFGEQSWAADFADIDNDGDMDCYVGNHEATSYLMRNNGNGTFTNITAAAGMAGVTWMIIQTVFRDFNNDGWVDLLLTGQQQQIWINNRNSTFSLAANPFTSQAMESCAVGDLNRDGFTDIYAGYATFYNQPAAARPDKLFLAQPNGNNFLSLTLRGVASNASGSGSRIELYGPWGQQVREVRSGESYGVTHSFTQIFGMGNAASATRLRVRWASGAVDEAWNVAAGQFRTLREGSTAAPTLANPGTQSHVRGDAVNLLPSSGDPTGDVLTFSAAGLPPGLGINSATGRITGAIPLAAGSSYSVTLSVTDGWSTVSRSFTWNIADPPAVLLATEAPAVDGAFDVTITFTVPVAGLAPGDFVVQNGSVTGLSGSGAGYTARITPAAAGVVRISLPANAAQDAGGHASTPSNVLPVTYTPPNAPPQIASPGPLTNERGAGIGLQISATDPEGQPLTFSAAGLPAGLSIQENTGFIFGTITAPAGTQSSVTLTVSDGSLDASVQFTWTVTGPTFAGWREAQDLSGQGGEENPDGDAYSNLQEFAHGLPPASGANGALPLELVIGSTVDAVVRRVSSIQGVAYALEFIADLANSGPGGAGWGNVPIIPVITAHPDGSETALYQNVGALPALAGGSGFVRVRVSADLNGDGDTADAGETARSEVAGWLPHSFAAGTQTFALPFAKPPVFTGLVESNTATAVDVSTSVGNASISALLQPGKSYQVEALSGPMEGHRWTVNAGSTAQFISVVTNGTVALAPNLLQGSRIALRERHTLGELFPAAVFDAGSSPTDSDRILTYQGGIPDPWTTYFLADLSGAGLGVHWVRTGGGIATQDGMALDPCSGFIVQADAARPAVILSGFVRSTRLACPLPSGYSLVGSAFPIAASPRDRGMAWNGGDFNGFAGGLSPTAADTILLWNGDATPGIDGYTTCWLLDAGIDPWRRWVRTGDSGAQSCDDLKLFAPQRAAFIQTNAGNSAWTMPPGWTP